MKISINGLWTITKWLMVIAVAYFSWKYFQTPTEFSPSHKKVSEFTYQDVNPMYAMNIVVKDGNPIQVDTIYSTSNGTPEYFFLDDEWYIKTKSLSGREDLVLVKKIAEIYYIKKGEDPE